MKPRIHYHGSLSEEDCPEFRPGYDLWFDHAWVSLLSGMINEPDFDICPSCSQKYSLNRLSL